MRFLFITPRFPYPPYKGDQLRAYRTIRHLAGQGHQVILVSFCTKADLKSLPELQPYCTTIHCLRISLIEKLLNFIFTLFSKRPLQTFPFRSNKAARLLKKIIKEEKPDLIHLVLIRVAHFLPLFEGIPVVIDFVDSLALNMQRRLAKEIWLLKPIFWLEWRRMLAYENEIAGKVNCALVVSAAEKAAIQNRSKVKVIPVGVDINNISEAKRQIKSGRIVFSGNLEYFPNIDAARYFATEVLPLIKKSCPDIQFHMVGVNPARALKQLHNGRDIFLIGYVPNIYDYISSAELVVAPLRAGTGVQIKVLEAMACRVPIVATSVAISGIGATAREQLLVADTTTDLAATVIRLLKDKKQQEQLTARAYSFVRDNFSWERIFAQLDDIYNSLLSRPGSV